MTLGTKTFLRCRVVLDGSGNRIDNKTNSVDASASARLSTSPIADVSEADAFGCEVPQVGCFSCNFTWP